MGTIYLHAKNPGACRECFTPEQSILIRKESKKVRCQFRLWDCGFSVPAFIRRPKDIRIENLARQTMQEVELGIRYYIPARNLLKSAEDPPEKEERQCGVCKSPKT